jgi:FMN phosphatase YigB (HAD superfamily)
MADIPITQNIALIFDWGDTVMKVFPQYPGPMANWPEVREVEGVVEALEKLLGRYPMVLASNAADSQADQIWKALRRVGLGDYFKAVFTARELGSAKPELRFFRQIESVLARSPFQLVMIGDSYTVDVVGAKAAGWKAIWYNPGCQAAPGLVPLHDAEITGMQTLPQAVQHLNLPDYATCLGWLESRGSPYNLLAHLQLVAAIAYQLAVWLRGKGEDVDPILAHRGGLLHDLAKVDSIRLHKERGELGDHASMARDMLIRLGQPELAEIAHRHMLYQDPEDPRRPLNWEQKLVLFADKLAEGSRLVSLEERMQALKGRYPQVMEELEASRPILLGLREELCSHLGITPQELDDQLREAVGTK